MQAERLPHVLATRLSPVCVAVSADEIEPLFERARAALAESRFLELRLDALKEPEVLAAALEPLRQFCRQHPDAAVLATCRRVAGGGAFIGSVTEQLALLVRCAQAGALAVDVELETLAALAEMPVKAGLASGGAALPEFGAALRAAGTFLLVSAHDFAAASDPQQTLARLRQLGAAAGPSIFKVVTTAHCLADNLGMLDWLERASAEVPVVGICMGAAGVPSRVLALSRGAAFTFASVGGGHATAAGQMDVATLLGRYRAAQLTRATRVYGVAGNPVSHSLSPVLHNAAFAAAGVDAVYLPLHTTGVDDLLAFVRGLPVDGLSVTMPWKIEMVARLDRLDPLAEKIGAVNTVTRLGDGGLSGTNTDAAAIVEPLARQIGLQGARVLLLGAGGAARAAAFALVQAGAAVWILNRTVDAAARLAEECGAQVAAPGELHGFDVVVQATPAGMVGMQQRLPLPETALDGVKVVFEMVYRPAETRLTRTSRARGITVVQGLTMFVEQGARQWSLWTGMQAPLETMRRALEQELQQALEQEPELAGI